MQPQGDARIRADSDEPVRDSARQQQQRPVDHEGEQPECQHVQGEGDDVRHRFDQRIDQGQHESDHEQVDDCQQQRRRTRHIHPLHQGDGQPQADGITDCACKKLHADDSSTARPEAG